MIKKIVQNKKGITLLEIVVGVAIVGIIAISLYMALFNVTKLMSNAKHKIGAVALANEQMEIIRNLAYEDVGTAGWIPSGPIEQSKEINRNNFNYKVTTSVEYVDDAFDGIGSADLIETDYKLVQVTVSWVAGGGVNKIVFVSKFVPEGLESNAGGGTLSVNLINTAAQAIKGVTVKIDSVTDTPAIHGTVNTAADGNVRIPGLPPQEYKITAVKDGYATVQTYGAPPASAFSPVDNNLFITEGDIVIKTLTMNESADLLLKAVDVATGDGIKEIDIEIVGGLTIGTNPMTLTVEQNKSTNSAGEVKLDEIDPGSYNIIDLIELGNTEYKYVGSDSLTPIQLISGDDKTSNLLFAKKTIDSLLIIVKNIASDELIGGAEVKVSNSSGFEQTTTTSVDGIVYFPITENPPVTMMAGEYTVEIKTPNFIDYLGDKEVNKLTTHEVFMTSQ